MFAQGTRYLKFSPRLANISGFSKKSFDYVEKKYSMGIPADVCTRYTVSPFQESAYSLSKNVTLSNIELSKESIKSGDIVSAVGLNYIMSAFDDF